MKQYPQDSNLHFSPPSASFFSAKIFNTETSKVEELQETNKPRTGPAGKPKLKKIMDEKLEESPMEKLKRLENGKLLLSSIS